MPKSAAPTTMPSRLSSMPATLLSSGARVTLSFTSFGARFWTRSFALRARSPWLACWAAPAASENIDHALAVWPFFS